MEAITSAIIDMANKYFGDFKVRGDEITAEYCPFCNGGRSGDRYTFAVNKETGMYNCMRGSCNEKGTFKQLAEHYGDPTIGVPQLPVNYKKKVRTYVKPDPSILRPLTDDIVTYFAKRKISEETLRDFNISSDEHGNIVFPFYKDGVLTYIKYREPQKFKEETDHVPGTKRRQKEWQMSDTEPILFGMDMISFNKPLIITEGQCDAMAIYESGHHNVVSVPCGCDNMKWLDTCAAWLEKIPTFILFGDNDQPGIKMVANLIDEFGKDRCLVPQEYPELIINGRDQNRLCKDANEILVTYGPQFLSDMIDSCESAPVEGILNLAEVPFVDPESIPRIYSRIPALDDAIGGFAEGSLTVISGKRGEGKSTFSGPILLNAVQQGYAVAAYSGELPAYRFLEWIMLQATERKYIGLKKDRRSGKNYTCVSPDIQSRIREWLNGKFYLFDNSVVNPKQTEAQAILERFRIMARKFGVKLFLVDNLMVALRSAELDENKAQANFTAELKAFAVKYNVAVLMVAHPRKTKSGEAFTNDDVSGSSA